jgi:hypothetical protein
MYVKQKETASGVTSFAKRDLDLSFEVPQTALLVNVNTMTLDLKFDNAHFVLSPDCQYKRTLIRTV